MLHGCSYKSSNDWRLDVPRCFLGCKSQLHKIHYRMAVSLMPTLPILFSRPSFSSAVATGGNYYSRLPLQASPRPCLPHVQASCESKATPSSSIEHKTTDEGYEDAAPQTLSSYGPSLWGDYFLNYEPKPLQAYTTPTYTYNLLSSSSLWFAS